MAQKKTETRTSPEIDKTVLKNFKTTVRVFNEGKLKNRYGSAVEESMIMYQAMLFLRSPLRLKRLEEYVDIDKAEIEDADEYRQDVADYVRENKEVIREAAQMIDSGIAPEAGEELARATRDAEDNTESEGGEHDDVLTKSDLADMLEELKD